MKKHILGKFKEYSDTIELVLSLSPDNNLVISQENRELITDEKE